MTKKPRFLKATLIAPLAVVPIMLGTTLIAILAGAYNEGFSQFNAHDYLAVIAMSLYAAGVAIVVAYGYTLFLGLPAYFIMWKLGRATTVRCAVVGAVLGGAFGVFYQVPSVILYGAFYGATVATCFSVIASRQPRRSEVSPIGDSLGRR